MITILTTLFGLTLAAAAPGPADLPLDTWVPQLGDRMLVDTEKNIGYLIHENGAYTSFPVLTGQRRVVHYIGRTYNAATPNRTWKVTSEETKGDRITFGPTGTFLRLSYKDDETPYGIHGHRSFDKMLAEGDRYRSMGCVLVSESVLILVRQTFTANNGSIDVVTAANVDLAESKTSPLSERPSWIGA